MKLSELKKQVDTLSRKAKKDKVDPEIRAAVLPKFWTSVSLRAAAVSSIGLEGEPVVYLIEDKELGAIAGDIFE